MFTASMRFDLGEDVEALRDLVHRWAQERVRPMAAQIDNENAFPSELWREMGELGLLGITVEEEFGGSNMGYLAHAVAVEEIARASASVSLLTVRIRTFASIKSSLTGRPIKRPDTCPNWSVVITWAPLR